MKNLAIALLISSTCLAVSSAQAQSYMPKNPGLFIMEQVPDLRGEVATVDFTRTIYTPEKTLDTETCTLHRDEPSIAMLRRHLICQRDSSGSDADRTFEEIFIGNTYFRKIDNGPWLQYDDSTLPIDEATYFLPLFNRFWTERQYITKYASAEFSPMATDTADRWYIQQQTFPMPFFHTLISSFGHLQEVDSAFTRAFFSENPSISGTYTRLSENSGGFSMSGKSNEYNTLDFDLIYRPNQLLIESEAKPLTASFNSPELHYRILLENRDITALFNIRYEGNNGSEIGYRLESGSERALEKRISVPVGAILVTEKTLDTYTPCVFIQFKDVCNHWSYDWMERARRVGYIGQIRYGDNPEYYLQPDNAIARSEFVRLIDESRSYELIADALNLKAPEYVVRPEAYTPSDADPTAWYIGDVAKALYLGIAQFQDGNRFRPNDTLNRAETMTFLARVIDKVLQNKYSVVLSYYDTWRAKNSSAAFAYFPDVALDAWYAPYVVFMADMGLLDRSQPRFRSGDPVTRAEAITLLERLREAMPRILTSDL